MHPCGILMPGAFRLRALQPLSEDDGSCRLVYDVERATVCEVPEELRFHVARALDTGDLDEEILAWLVSEDLWTAERCGDWAGAPEPDDAGRALGGAWTAEGGSRIHSGLGPAGEEAHGWIGCESLAPALAELGLVFLQSHGYPRLTLHLDWAGSLPAGDVLEELVAEARRQAASAGQQVTVEVVLDPSRVTVEAAARVAALAVHVRLRCASPSPTSPRSPLPPLIIPTAALSAAAALPGDAAPPARGDAGGADAGADCPWLRAEAAVRLLALPCEPAARCSRLTLQCRLDGAARLIDAWRWAQANGVHSLDVRLDLDRDENDPLGATDEERTRLYRQDLSAVYEETCRELAAGRRPVELQSINRIVRRLTRNEGVGDPAGSFEDEAIPCQGCWARHVCSHSALVALPAGADRRGPSAGRCAAWTAEAEVAVRLYHHLAQTDPLRWPAIQSFLDAETEVRPFLLTLTPFSYAGLLSAKPS